MLFGFGPVLRFELITTARRARYYLARAAYGSVLLFLLWGQFAEWERSHLGGGTPEEVRLFAESAFIAFAMAQITTLLCLLPALVAGVIADEHQRKTLHYLLASRLSSAEIVLGKLGARLVHVGTFVALGLPVVSLLSLHGGLDPEKVFYVYFSTLTTVLAVSGLSIFISVLARRPRDAILGAYALEALWLLGPPAIADIVKYCGGVLWWAWPVNSGLLLTNPLVFLDRMTNTWYGYWPGTEFLAGLFPGLDPSVAAFWAMTAIQAMVGLSSLTIAIVGLRPLRGGSWPGSEPKAGWWTRLRARAEALSRRRAAAAVVRNELLASRVRRPSCGDNPMLWKERHTAPGGGLRWLGGRPIMLVCGVLLGCYLFDVAYPVVAEALTGRPGFGSLPEVNESLRFATMALSALGLLTIAASSAVSITGEREQDTWISLATTLLTPGEIILAKQFGAAWSARRVGLAMLITWAVGILLGAIHPLAAALTAALAAVIAWFAATVGVAASAGARNSTRALAATFIALLVLLNPWPYWLASLLCSPSEFAAMWSSARLSGGSPWALTPEAMMGTIVIGGCFAGAGVLFTSWSIRRLNARWGRG